MLRLALTEAKGNPSLAARSSASAGDVAYRLKNTTLRRDGC